MTNVLSSQQVARILYKEIVDGDLRKILAQSNDSETGGGARDFRFGSYLELMPVIQKMFPITIKEKRKRAGIVSEIDVLKGVFYWQDSEGGPTHHQESYFEPPTDVRPSEGRIARVHEYSCFDTSRIPRVNDGHRVLLLLIQRMDNTVWPHFVDEYSLRTPGIWDPVVARELINCLDAKRAAGRAVIGYYDFTTKSSYCNGK